MEYNPYNNFLQQIDKLEVHPFIRKEEFDMGIFDSSFFDERITHLDQMTDQDCYNFIKGNMEYIATLITNREWKYPQVLLTNKFLDTYNRVLTSIPITYPIKIASNSICYSYLVQQVNDDNMDKMLQISRTVNYPYIRALVGLGLPEGIAFKLAMCRFSSLKESTNIRRLNFTMAKQDPDIMTCQMIVWIYEKLFDQAGELFEQTMFEYYSPEQELDLGNDFSEVYSTISLAILTIVNNMSMANIDRIIRSYIADWEYSGRPPVRFSLISLSADYSRIQTIVEIITKEGTYVP